MFKGRTTKPATKPITARALRSRNNNNRQYDNEATTKATIPARTTSRSRNNNKRPRDNDDFEMGVSDMNDDDTYYEDNMSDDEIKFLGSML